MDKFVETQASSIDNAVEKALAELNVSKDKVEIEVLSKGGLFSKAKVRVTVKETLADKMAEFINGTLERMELKSRATVEEKDNTLYVRIEGEDSGAAIGYRGETLDAFQYLALTFLNEHKGECKKVVVDCENYREKRRETLTALALRLAEKSVRLCRKIELEPMNPFERRIIHSALAESELARTESVGEEQNRHIVIVPLGVELKDERPLKNGERDSRDRHDGHGRGGRRDDRRGRYDGRDNRRDDRRRNNRYDRKPREEEQEVEDGNVYLGYFTEQDDFVKPAPQAGPPKFKSFGGKKRF
ncbi:MAG: protein jag [Bacteroides sp.]|nr:protein jag [Bacillota bacterium]MCM1394108.1 protein jag [[Eubacterium] siraeum]MCM1455939.1 protein jag [Bacteroides sp.]